jgi:hypothetical protein
MCQNNWERQQLVTNTFTKKLSAYLIREMLAIIQFEICILLSSTKNEALKYTKV